MKQLRRRLFALAAGGLCLLGATNLNAEEFPPATSTMTPAEYPRSPTKPATFIGGELHVAAERIAQLEVRGDLKGGVVFWSVEPLKPLPPKAASEKPHGEKLDLAGPPGRYRVTAFVIWFGIEDMRLCVRDRVTAHATVTIGGPAPRD